MSTDEFLSKQQILQLLQNMNLSIDKFKEIEKTVTELTTIFYGSPIQGVPSFYNKFEILSKEVNDLNKIISSNLQPEINSLRESFKDFKTQDSYKGDTNRHNLERKFHDISKEISSIREFQEKLKNFPKALLIYVPALSFIFNVIAYFVERALESK